MSPLFGVSLQEAFLYWDYNNSWFNNMFMSYSTGYLFVMAKSGVTFVLYSYLTGILAVVASRGKLKNQPKIPLIIAYFLFPFFLFLQIPLDACAIFIKEVKWVKIPRGEGSPK